MKASAAPSPGISTTDRSLGLEPRSARARAGSSWDRHPDEEALESCLLGEACAPTRARVEEHLLVCEDCRGRLAELDAFIAAIRDAAAEMIDSVGWTHATSDGLVRLEATRFARGPWIARFQGKDLDGGRTFGSPREAFGFLHRAFEEMYPEHFCTSRCHHRK